MALLTCNFFSDALGLSTAMTVILPQTTHTQIGMADRTTRSTYPTLWLLHGLSDDHTIWTRRTSIERYVAGRELAVVMPAVHRSFYTDMAAGGRYWQFVSEELPAIARSMLPLSARREDNFVAGLSMGGYGAFKLAMHHPERYAAAASLSGAVDVAALAERERDPWRVNEWAWTFGDRPAEIRGSDNDLLHLAERLAERAAAGDVPLPQLFLACGAADFLYQDNVRYHEHLKSLGLAHRYDVDSTADHAWDYWDTAIRDVLDWLPRRGRSA